MVQPVTRTGRYPDVPLPVDRAHSVVEAFRAYGLPEAVGVLADHTALSCAHEYVDGAPRLTEEQTLAVGRWIHRVQDELTRLLSPSRTATRNEHGQTVVPTGVHAHETLDSLRARLSGLHFAKEMLSDTEREILGLAEALLAIIDVEDPGGFRR